MTNYLGEAFNKLSDTISRQDALRQQQGMSAMEMLMRQQDRAADQEYRDRAFEQGKAQFEQTHGLNVSNAEANKERYIAELGLKSAQENRAQQEYDRKLLEDATLSKLLTVPGSAASTSGGQTVDKVIPPSAEAMANYDTNLAKLNKEVLDRYNASLQPTNNLPEVQVPTNASLSAKTNNARLRDYVTQGNGNNLMSTESKKQWNVISNALNMPTTEVDSNGNAVVVDSKTTIPSTSILQPGATSKTTQNKAVNYDDLLSKYSQLKVPESRVEKITTPKVTTTGTESRTQYLQRVGKNILGAEGLSGTAKMAAMKNMADIAENFYGPEAKAPTLGDMLQLQKFRYGVAKDLKEADDYYNAFPNMPKGITTKAAAQDWVDSQKKDVDKKSKDYSKVVTMVNDFSGARQGVLQGASKDIASQNLEAAIRQGFSPAQIATALESAKDDNLLSFIYNPDFNVDKFKSMLNAQRRLD